MQNSTLRVGKAVEKLFANRHLSSGNLHRKKEPNTLERDRRILTKKAEQGRATTALWELMWRCSSWFLHENVQI